MVALSSTSQPNALDILARRVSDPRSVSLPTLRRRYREAAKLCATIRATLRLLDVTTDGATWGGVYRLIMRAEEVSTLAYTRYDAALQEEMARRFEAQQLGEALMHERWLHYEAQCSGELDAALAWEGE